MNGTELYDSNGNKFVMRGINHPHVWFTSELNTALDGIVKTGANCVRVVLADGQQWSKTSADDLKNVIAQCEKRKLVAVVELHDATGNDSVSALKTAAEYWIEMKSILNEHKSTVIVNIANEWHHENWGNPGAWAAGYKEVIPMLRNAGIENTLMVDCDGYGQFADSLFRNDYAKQIFAADTQSNTMFSIHMYDSAGKDANTVKGHIDNCFKAGICAVIGEFAADHGSRGDVAEQTILDYCTEKGMGYIGWSWKGNGDGLGSLDISNDWAGNNLSSWGETLVNGNNGIKQTSKTCTVFG